MHDFCTLSVISASKLQSCGSSLVKTLSGVPVTILLRGELGAGKTTFVQGFARGLGITQPVASPTYALEQRYATTRGELLHIDLYRLSEADAKRLLHTSQDHPGIRCIEWAERADMHDLKASGNVIDVHISETPAGREVSCTFFDCPMPTTTEILQWRQDVHLPPNIAAHCDAVGKFAQTLADGLIERGTIVRRNALLSAGQLHDLLRFVDFRDGAGPAAFQPSSDDVETWKLWQERYAGKKHEAACAAFLREKGYALVADIVEPHGLMIPPPPRPMVEQQLLFYGDKRVQNDTVVTLEERFDDFRKRYTGGKPTPEHDAWLQELRALENELFGANAP